MGMLIIKHALTPYRVTLKTGSYDLPLKNVLDAYTMEDIDHWQDVLQCPTHSADEVSGFPEESCVGWDKQETAVCTIYNAIMHRWTNDDLASFSADRKWPKATLQTIKRFIKVNRCPIANRGEGQYGIFNAFNNVKHLGFGPEDCLTLPDEAPKTRHTRTSLMDLVDPEEIDKDRALDRKWLGHTWDD